MRGGKTQAMLDKIEKCLKIKAMVIVPVANKHMARSLKKAAENRGIWVNIKAGINYGQHPQPHKSRRSIWLELLK